MWELGNHGVDRTVIVDNAGGHLMQRGQVDLCIVDTDRFSANGDVANKIGTYLKAPAAHDNGVPFYVALPSPTIDWTLADGFAIPIEERSTEEVTRIPGRLDGGTLGSVIITPTGSRAANPAFDVTSARLVTGLIPERRAAGRTEVSGDARAVLIVLGALMFVLGGLVGLCASMVPDVQRAIAPLVAVFGGGQTAGPLRLSRCHYAGLLQVDQRYTPRLTDHRQRLEALDAKLEALRYQGSNATGASQRIGEIKEIENTLFRSRIDADGVRAEHFRAVMELHERCKDEPTL